MTVEQLIAKQESMSNEALVGFAEEQVSKLAETRGRSHTMCVPPEITDTDMLFSELIKRFKKANQIKYNDLPEEMALATPILLWRFCAYKTQENEKIGKHYFIKDFLDHGEMKEFSGEHAFKEKKLYKDYCSMYWRIEQKLVPELYTK